MLVHVVTSFQQLFEVLVSNGKTDAKADRRPERVAAAHPVPKSKHVCRIDAELRHFGGVCAKRHEVFGYSGRLTQS